MFRPNSLKRRLLNGERAIASWLLLNSPDIAEIMSHAGYDALMIDHEHTYGSLKDAVAAMRAASSTDTTMLLRIPDNDPVYLKRALDSGAEGIMVPMINTAAEAQAFVDGCRYPVDGLRGVSFPTIRASTYGYHAADYLGGYRDNQLLIGQVETAEAVKNINAIAGVDGLDMVFIGIGDLSASIGKLAQFEDKELLSLLKKAEKAVLGKKKLLGGMAFNEDMAMEMFERGYHFIIQASDLALLRDNAKKNVDVMRKRLASAN